MLIRRTGFQLDCRSYPGKNRVSRQLREQGIEAQALHGDMSPRKRQDIVSSFAGSGAGALGCRKYKTEEEYLRNLPSLRERAAKMGGGGSCLDVNIVQSHAVLGDDLQIGGLIKIMLIF